MNCVCSYFFKSLLYQLMLNTQDSLQLNYSENQLAFNQKVFNFDIMLTPFQLRGFKTFALSAQLTMAFHLIRKAKTLKKEGFSCFKNRKPINVKMSTIVGILTSAGQISRSVQMSTKEFIALRLINIVFIGKFGCHNKTVLYRNPCYNKLCL